MQKLAIVLSIFIFSVQAFAVERIRSYRVSTHPLQMIKIAKQFEVVKKLDIGFEVYVLEEDVKAFLKLAPKSILLEKNIHADLSNKRILNYKNYSDVEKELKLLSENFKTLTMLETYGVSKGGRNLYALKISTGGENKPRLMVTAATHGDELITTEVLLALTKELLEGHGKNERLTKIIDSREIYIIPVVSPDSFEARERYVQRKDPNRSYPWPENENNPTVDVIAMMMNFANTKKFSGSLDLHAYGKLVMYPWGFTKKSPDAADVVTFKDIVQTMAKDNQYTAGQISTTIYVAEGSSADYFYWKTGTKAIAAELGREKIPHYSKIPSVVNESREMIWSFLEYFN